MQGNERTRVNLADRLVAPSPNLKVDLPVIGAARFSLGRGNHLSLNRQSAILMFVAMLVLTVRRPAELFRGYFYAEEGATYFHYAWNATALRALLAPHQGYYSLYPNLVTLIAARLLPIQTAAAFGAWCALAVVLLMIYLVTQCDLFVTFEERALAAGVCLFASPGLNMTLSTINSQYFLAICTALILFSSAKRHAAFTLLTLVTGGLTGVVSCLFTPFFLLKAFLERSRERALQAIVLLFCTSLQIAIVMSLRRHSSDSATPHHSLSEVLDALLLHSPLTEFGSRAAGHFAGLFLVAHPSNLVWMGAAAICIGLEALLLYLLRDDGRTVQAMILSGLFCGLVSLFAAVGQGGAYVVGSIRYLLISNALIGLALVVAYLRRRRAAITNVTVPVMLLTALFLAGAVDLLTYSRHTARCEPPWPSQIRHWIADQTVPLEVGPHDWGRAFTLSHAHPNRSDLPSAIYDSIRGRTIVAIDAPSTPCRNY